MLSHNFFMFSYFTFMIPFLSTLVAYNVNESSVTLSNCGYNHNDKEGTRIFPVPACVPFFCTRIMRMHAISLMMFAYFLIKLRIGHRLSWMSLCYLFMFQWNKRSVFVLPVPWWRWCSQLKLMGFQSLERHIILRRKLYERASRLLEGW